MPLRCVKRGGDKQMIAWLKNRLSLQSVHMFSHTEAKHAFSFIEMSTREAGGADRERGCVFIHPRIYADAGTDPSIIVKLLRALPLRGIGVVAVTRWFTAGAAYALIKCHFAKFRRSNLPARNSPPCYVCVEQAAPEREMRPKEGHFWRPTDPQLCSQHVRFQWFMALSITICCYINWGNNCIQPCNVLIRISWPRTLNINIIINFIWPMASAALCRISPYRQMLW